MAHNYNPLNAFGKMPMEKAKRAKPKEEDRQNVG
jgi:hypothetical protein